MKTSRIGVKIKQLSKHADAGVARVATKVVKDWTARCCKLPLDATTVRVRDDQRPLGYDATSTSGDDGIQVSTGPRPPSMSEVMPTRDRQQEPAATDPVSPESYDDSIEREFEEIENITPEQLAEMDGVLNKQKRREHEKGNHFWNVKPVLLRHVAPLINDPANQRQMTTAQTETWLDATFASMSDAEFSRGYYGLEVYYERNPDPTHNVRYRPIKPTGVRAYTIDHVLARYFSPFDHPRFYIVLPAGGLNAALSSKGIVWRTSTVIGITKTELRLITNDIKAIKVLLRKEMPAIYAELSSVRDIRFM